MVGSTDERHVRDALRNLHAVISDLVEYAFAGTHPSPVEDIRECLAEADDHIEAIRVRGEAKRKEQADDA